MKRILIPGVLFSLLQAFMLQSVKAQVRSMTFHDLPVENSGIKNSFSVIGNSLITIPLKGGIYELNFDTWLISPDAKLQILNYDICMHDTSLLLVVRKDSMLMVAKGKNDARQYLSKIYCTLPVGFCQVTSLGLDSFFLWHFNKKVSTIFFYNTRDKLQTIFRTKEIITAFYPVNTTTVLFAIGPRLFSISAGEKPVALKNFPADIDGIALDDKGHFLISTFNGIYEVDESQKITLMTNEFHGLMKLYKNTLFVFDRARNKVIELGL